MLLRHPVTLAASVPQTAALGDFVAAKTEHGHYVSGSCGTGKSHLATGLCVAACRQKRRVRFTTAAALGAQISGHVRKEADRRAGSHAFWL
jgi:DNA replication protein DnaC